MATGKKSIFGLVLLLWYSRQAETQFVKFFRLNFTHVCADKCMPWGYELQYVQEIGVNVGFFLVATRTCSKFEKQCESTNSMTSRWRKNNFNGTSIYVTSLYVIDICVHLRIRLHLLRKHETSLPNWFFIIFHQPHYLSNFVVHLFIVQSTLYNRTIF